MDFHLSPIFVNLILLVLTFLLDPTDRSEERAILLDREPVPGRLEFDPAGALVFRPDDGGPLLPARTMRRIENAVASPIPRGPSPGHRVFLWGNESLSGTVASIEPDSVHLKTTGGELLQVPTYLIARIEHFHGNAVILTEAFETDSPLGRIGGKAQRTKDQAASGQWSLRLNTLGDEVEYRLHEPISSGWLEFRFYDSGDTLSNRQFLCEMDFESRAGARTMQVLLGWDADSYGLGTPQGPSFPVQRLARSIGWNRVGLRFAPDRTTVLINEAVLAQRDVGVGSLRGVRFMIRAAQAEAAAPSNDSAAFLDDFQIASAIASPAERQPSRDQDDLQLTNGDQVFGLVESATAREITIKAEFGTVSFPWEQLHRIHFAARAVPVRSSDGPRVRVQFLTDPTPQTREEDNDALEGVVTELNDEIMRLDHPHIGPIRIIRNQLRVVEFFATGRWLAIDSRFHHFGEHVDVRLQVPHPGGTDRSWEFTLDRASEHAALVLHAVGMEAIAAGSERNKREASVERRTFAAINGQTLDPLGLNHLLAPNSRGAVRLVVPVPPGLVRPGRNVLRIYQTPQRDDPHSFDDCGLFGIGLELSDP